MNHYTFLALELAEERARDAERAAARERLLAQVTTDGPTRPSYVRRPAARILAAFSVGTAAVVRRLDECTADDLGRALAPTE